VALRLSERQQAIIFVAILIAAIAGLYATTQEIQPVPVRASAVYLVRLDVEGAGWSIEYAPPATMNNTAFGLLVEASAKLGFTVAYVWYQIPQGVFVTAINGSVNGEGSRFWLYQVNGVYPSLAADHQALHDDDVVRWTFSASQDGM
jgi:Domain of unknown function (DUF4430)